MSPSVVEEMIETEVPFEERPYVILTPSADGHTLTILYIYVSI